MLVDGDGLILAANRACETLLGCATARLVGASLGELTRDEGTVSALLRSGSRSPNRLPAALMFEFDGGKPIDARCEVALLRPRRGSRAAQICLRLFDRQQHARQFLLLNQRIDELSREVNRRRSAEERLQLLSRQLIDAARHKDEFLAMLAHELRNPLAPIALGIDLLRGIEPAQPKLDRVSAMMKRQVGHLTRLINDLLDAARLTHGKLALRRQAVALDDILARAIELVQPLIDERALRLVVGEIAPLQLSADGDRLVQVFGNVLGNAAKFCQSGDEIRINAAQTGDEVVVSVSDDGAGIDAEFLPQIFNAFVQDDRSLDRAKGGLGVGLSIVRNIVELHGGRVVASSQGRGFGTEIRVHLPLSSAPDEVAATVATNVHAAGVGPGHKAAAAGLRVLVVEDNTDAAEAMRELLGDWGHQASASGNGPDALERWASWQPDVVCLDIGLPGMSGHDVARQLRQLAAGSPLLLIAISGYDAPGDRLASRESGFDLHLSKPVNLDQLEALLAAHAASIDRHAKT